MSDPAYFFEDGLVYYGRSEASSVDSWLLWGPDVLRAYLRTLGPPRKFERIDDVAFGGFAVFKEEKRLLWYGGGNTADCPFYCRLFLRLQRALWPGWIIEWAGNGLNSLLEASGYPPEDNDGYPLAKWDQGELNGPLPEAIFRPLGQGSRLEFERQLCVKQFETLGREIHLKSGINGAVSVRQGDGSLVQYPLHDGDVTGSFLWAGPQRILEMLVRRFPRPVLGFPSSDEPIHLGGFHLDLISKTLGWWSHISHRDPVPPDAWPGWTVVDWETNYEEHVAATEGRLQPEPPATQDLLSRMAWAYISPESNGWGPYGWKHQIYDENDELIEEVEFPVALERRRQLWNTALKRAGYDQRPYPAL